MRGLAEAIGFLTVFPIGRGAGSRDEVGAPLAGALIYFPVVGLLIGIVVAAANALLTPLLPPLAVAAIVVTLMVALTGGLHWDGLVDSCDALFASRTKEERLRILKDTSVGAYGLLGGVAAFVCYFAFLVSLPAHLAVPVLVILPVVGRMAMLLGMAFFPYAREAGMGSLFGRLPHGALLTGISLTFAAALLALGPIGFFLTLSTLAAVIAAGIWAKRRLGGLTGDVYGALGVFAELIMLSSVLFWTARGVSTAVAGG